MIGNKYTGDSIAAEFMKIMSPKTSPGETLEKSASAENDLAEVAEGMLMDSVDEQPQESPLDSALQAVESMLEEGEEPEHIPTTDGPDIADVDGIEAELDAHAAFTASETYLIKGLGKIAGGLRRKNESFAADMVEATARSIYGDIMKESSYRNNVMQSLSKIASELSESGDSFASDLVNASIRRIANK